MRALAFVRTTTSIFLSLFLVAPAAAQYHDEPRMAVGQCVKSKVSAISSRLENEPSSGSYVTLANGIVSMSYEVDPQAQKARIGDTVFACLVHVPDGCPRRDNRGKVYTVTDFRTGGSWTMPNDEHSCGGA